MLYESPSRLSQHALTSHHGRLLADSGFTKQDCHLNSLEVLAHTGMKPRPVSSYQYGVVTGRLSSGRPAIQNIPRTDVPSTSRQALREVLCMQYTGMNRADWLYFAKTSCLPTRLEPQDTVGTQSWGPVSDSIRSHGYSNVGAMCSRGLIQMLLDKQRDQKSAGLSLWWDAESRTLTQSATPSATTLKQ